MPNPQSKTAKRDAARRRARGGPKPLFYIPPEKQPDVGAVNLYVCNSCDFEFATIHVDQGVTPMFLACRENGCNGRSISQMYRPTDVEPTYEWFKPSDKATHKLPKSVRPQVKDGLLLLRKIEKESTDG